MFTKEIDREEWNKFFDDFSKRHKGWTATVDVLRSDLGDQKAADKASFVGISADPKNIATPIEIILGTGPDTHVARIVNRPTKVWITETEQPGHDAIEIESEDGTRTLVSFSHVHPEQGDRELASR
jgi:hypothetical protein